MTQQQQQETMDTCRRSNKSKNGQAQQDDNSTRYIKSIGTQRFRICDAESEP